MKAITAAAPGGADVLHLTDVPDPVAGPGEVLIAVAYAGVNFIDTYRRAAVYPMPFPHIVGSEGAGRVVAIGDGVDDFSVGQVVAWSDVAGSYAELVAAPVGRLLPVPDGIALDVAAALPLQGMTAHYLVNSTYPVQAGDPVLVHAGAGGVGLLLTQLAAERGGRVITAVSSADKAELSRSAGAAEVIRYDELADLEADLPPLVRAAAGGGVAVAYDGVGRATFDASLASLRRRGMLVLFGGSSGQVAPLDLQRLNRGGSLFVTRPTLGDYTATTGELRGRASELFSAVAGGRLDVRIGATYPLAQAAEAHRALEGRATTGKVLLQVG